MSQWYFYNTDAKSFSGAPRLHSLLANGIAVTGGPKKFGEELRPLQADDVLLMYQNGSGVVAVGRVLKPWDGKKHFNLQYYEKDGQDAHEYRVLVDWFLDLSDQPLGIEDIGYVPRGAVQRIVRARERLESLVNERANAPIRLSPDDALGNELEDEGAYQVTFGDQRPRVRREIRLRRGQAKFRNALRERYGNACVVTGCKVIALLEAAHIQDYRRDAHNDPQNGLLLRADVHTLFDLDLLGIEPDSLRVRLAAALKKDSVYCVLAGKRLQCNSKCRPSKEALRLRFKRFQARVQKNLG